MPDVAASEGPEAYGRPRVQARTIGTSVTIGALGVGPLIAGCLAQWVPEPLTVPYLVFVALGVIALAGLWTVPETGTRTPRSAPPDQLAGSKRRRVRLPVPESRVAMTSDLLIALYVGLAVPVIGAGVALDLGASAPSTVLGFAILVGLGVAVSGWVLRGRRPSHLGEI